MWVAAVPLRGGWDGCEEAALAGSLCEEQEGAFSRLYTQWVPLTSSAASPRGRNVLNSACVLAIYTSLQIFQESPQHK